MTQSDDEQYSPAGSPNGSTARSTMAASRGQTTPAPPHTATRPAPPRSGSSAWPAMSAPSRPKNRGWSTGPCCGSRGGLVTARSTALIPTVNSGCSTAADSAANWRAWVSKTFWTKINPILANTRLCELSEYRTPKFPKISSRNFHFDPERAQMPARSGFRSILVPGKNRSSLRVTEGGGTRIGVERAFPYRHSNPECRAARPRAAVRLWESLTFRLTPSINDNLLERVVPLFHCSKSAKIDAFVRVCGPFELERDFWTLVPSFRADRAPKVLGLVC